MSEAVFKLLSIFGNLTQRKLIALELSDKLPMLVETLNEEIDDANKVFERRKIQLADTDVPNIKRNYPVIAGQLKFSKEVCIVFWSYNIFINYFFQML